MHRKVVVYIAASLDGYIAKPDDDLSFLSLVQKEGEDYGYSKFIENVDTVVMGRRTYDWIMTQVPEFPHSEKITYVITKQSRPNVGKTIFYNDELKDLIIRLKEEHGKNIFIDGGAQIVNSLLRENLVDELVISIVPVMLGAGTRLFQDERPEAKLKLLEAKAFDTGLVQLHYQRVFVK